MPDKFGFELLGKAMSYNLFKNTSILYFVLVMLGAVVIAAVMKSLMRVRLS